MIIFIIIAWIGELFNLPGKGKNTPDWLGQGCPNQSGVFIAVPEKVYGVKTSISALILVFMALILSCLLSCFYALRHQNLAVVGLLHHKADISRSDLHHLNPEIRRITGQHLILDNGPPSVNIVNDGGTEFVLSLKCLYGAVLET